MIISTWLFTLVIVIDGDMTVQIRKRYWLNVFKTKISENIELTSSWIINWMQKFDRIWILTFERVCAVNIVVINVDFVSNGTHINSLNTRFSYALVCLKKNKKKQKQQNKIIKMFQNSYIIKAKYTMSILFPSSLN